VIPKFALLYKDLGVPLPGPTQLLIAITVDYRMYIFSAMAAFVLSIVGVFFWSRSEEGGVAFDRQVFRVSSGGRHVAEVSGRHSFAVPSQHF